MNFILAGYDNETEINEYIYLPEIGISGSIIKDTNSCPNFLFDLKSKNIINQNIFSIKYNINNDTNKEEKGKFLLEMIYINMIQIIQAIINMLNYILKIYFLLKLIRYMLKIN